MYPRGGAQNIADSMVADIEAHGGSVETGAHITDLASLDWGDPARGDLLMLNTSPRLTLTHPDIPASYARAIRSYRYGPAAAKVDFALDGPIPWANAEVGQSPTVHIGGSAAEIWESENAVARGRISDRPYVLSVQPSVFDPSRAPEGKAVLWAYIHVPQGSDLDATELVTRQVERFAPASATSSSPTTRCPRRRARRSTRRRSAETSWAAPSPSRRRCADPCSAQRPGAHRCAACISLRHRPRRVQVSTAWPGGTLPERR